MTLFAIGFITGVLTVCFYIIFTPDEDTENTVNENRQWQNLMVYDGTLKGQENYED